MVADVTYSTYTEQLSNYPRAHCVFSGAHSYMRLPLYSCCRIPITTGGKGLSAFTRVSPILDPPVAHRDTGRARDEMCTRLLRLLFVL